MLKLYSKAAEYALIALSYLSLSHWRQRFSLKVLCEKAGLKLSYTRKAFQTLSNANILLSVTGPGGGYRLAHHPDNISLLEIIRAIDGADAFDQCVLGLPVCYDGNDCPMHATWKPLKEKMLQRLDTITLGDIMRFRQDTDKDFSTRLEKM